MNSLVKSFLFSFIIAAVVFSVIAISVFPPFIHMIFDPNDNSGNTEDVDDDARDSSGFDDYSISASGTLGMLLIGTDQIVPDRTDGTVTIPDVGESDEIRKSFDEMINSGGFPIEKKIVFMTFVVFDSILSRVSVTYIPCETMVSFRDTYVDVSTMLYIAENGLYGTDIGFFSDYVLSLTGYNVDMYGLIDIDEYIRFADEHQGLTLYLQESVTVPQRSGRPASYSAGRVSVSSVLLRGLIMYDSYSSHTTKPEILESYCLSVLDEITTLAYYSDSNGIFDRCVSAMYMTNADHDYFETKKALFFSYGMYTHAKINLIGAYSVTDGVTRFYPDTANSISAFK